MKQGAENVKSIQRKRSRPLCQWHSSCMDASQDVASEASGESATQKCKIKEANVIEEFRLTTNSTEPVIICRKVGIK